MLGVDGDMIRLRKPLRVPQKNTQKPQSHRQCGTWRTVKDKGQGYGQKSREGWGVEGRGTQVSGGNRT